MRNLDLLDNLGRNDLARTAPSSEAVKDHQAGLVAERLVKGGLAVVLLAFPCRDNDVARAGKTLRHCDIWKTHVWRLCTPVSDILAVLEKNFCVKRGRYRFAVDVGLIEAVCRRAEVSSVLVNRDVDKANIVGICTENEVRQRLDD